MPDTGYAYPFEPRKAYKAKSGRLDIVGRAEVARMFHHRDRPGDPMPEESVSRWIAEGVLPDPDAVLAIGRVWRRSTIVKWANKTGRELRYE